MTNKGNLPANFTYQIPPDAPQELVQALTALTGKFPDAFGGGNALGLLVAGNLRAQTGLAKLRFLVTVTVSGAPQFCTTEQNWKLSYDLINTVNGQEVRTPAARQPPAGPNTGTGGTASPTFAPDGPSAGRAQDVAQGGNTLIRWLDGPGPRSMGPIPMGSAHDWDSQFEAICRDDTGTPLRVTWFFRERVVAAANGNAPSVTTPANQITDLPKQVNRP